MRIGRWLLAWLLACAARLTAASAVNNAGCPAGTAKVDDFATADGMHWSACEDLASPGGGLTLVPEAGRAVHLPKSYEPYSPEPDEAYYLGLGKQAVLGAKWDMLGDAILNTCDKKTLTTNLCEPTWARVERAVPVIRYSRGNQRASGNNFMCSPYAEESGVRTFTGSRSASVDATFSDHADDCTDNGFPRPQGYVMNLTAIARNEPPIYDFLAYVNFSAMAEGLVGGDRAYPNLIFYFPLLPQNFSGFGGSRYWTMIASPVPDMEGGREQSVWFRFQQLQCAAARLAPPCRLLGAPQYYDTYWYSNSPITGRWIRPELRANASGFYSNLLRVARYWDAELAAEGMMDLVLPERGCVLPGRGGGGPNLEGMECPDGTTGEAKREMPYGSPEQPLARMEGPNERPVARSNGRSNMSTPTSLRRGSHGTHQNERGPNARAPNESQPEPGPAVLCCVWLTAVLRPLPCAAAPTARGLCSRRARLRSRPSPLLSICWHAPAHPTPARALPLSNGACVCRPCVPSGLACAVHLCLRGLRVPSMCAFGACVVPQGHC